jgi:DNA-binding response OmpR family regulator
MNELYTILLVDDSENDRFLMRAAFRHAKFNCHLQEVENGEEAIAYLNRDGQYTDCDRFPVPAVMLLDLNMPMKSGFDVLKWVRTEKSHQRVSVFVLSASERVEDVQRAFDLGAHAYLVKPRTFQELIEMVHSLRNWLQNDHFPLYNAAVRG